MTHAGHRSAVYLLCACTFAACSRPHHVEDFSLAPEIRNDELTALGDALEDAQIVLLGENGHGVREFTETKVELIEWLHREHGFDLVVFESGLFECDRAWRRLDETGAGDALKACLRYPFEHAELLPLFERMKAARGTPDALAFSGMDFQAQGFDTEGRAAETFEWLSALDRDLAQRLARADSSLFQLPAQGGLGDSVYAYAHRNADRLIAAYGSAAAITSGTPSLVFRLAQGWVQRLALRGEAEARGIERLPGRYHELRDEWMARAVTALADSTVPERKVIVWLHNDHARYGRFPSAADSIRSTGGYLKEWYGDKVFSVGFFFGRGTIADNARRPRPVAPVPAQGLESYLARGPQTYLVLRSNDDPAVRAWAATELPYLRMGIDTLTLTPAREFDALVYIDSVSVPMYRID